MKTVLSAVAVKQGIDILTQKNGTDDLTEIKIKIPTYMAKILFNCVKCYAKTGRMEILFDEICTRTFTIGMHRQIMIEFRSPKEHMRFFEKLTLTRCGNCELLKKNIIEQLVKK